MNEELTALVAKIDAASAACPVRQRGYQDKCPRCGATSSDPCGPVLTAEHELVQRVRVLIRPEDTTPQDHSLGESDDD